MPSPIGVADLTADLSHAASDSFGSLYLSPRTMMAQATRAILLASATAATFVGRRSINRPSQGRFCEMTIALSFGLTFALVGWWDIVGSIWSALK
jgi:hypothetical protein